MTVPSDPPLLRSAWRHLALVNYAIDPQSLRDLVPRGTELDDFEGQSYVSVVGFLFLDTRILGVPLWFHQEFEEINLRFYVRRRSSEGWRRGVVFVKEIVSRPLVSIAARTLYHENYVTLPTAHDLQFEPGATPWLRSAKYSWRSRGRLQHVHVSADRAPSALVDGSLEEFITEHFWGYNTQRDGSSLEYQVEHPRWRVSQASAASLQCEVADLYGERFVKALSAPPACAFLADGSEVSVHRGAKL
jgi:uncharacterized protein YqjF (DUF2071 family)